MSMMQIDAASDRERAAIRRFLLWLYREHRAQGVPEIVLCERTPLAGWLPATPTIAELLDQFYGIDREQLNRERAAWL